MGSGQPEEELAAARACAMRVAQVFLSKGAKAEAVEVLTVWASARNDAEGHKLLAEALRHGSDSALAKAAFAKMEGLSSDQQSLETARAKWSAEALSRIEVASQKPSSGWHAEVGYNNNVKYRNQIFHIQTEDSGVKKPHIITHLFADGGRILKSYKRSYASLLGSESLSAEVRALMKGQHKEMYIALREGGFDDIIDGKTPGGMDILEGPPHTEIRRRLPSLTGEAQVAASSAANAPLTEGSGARALPVSPGAKRVGDAVARSPGAPPAVVASGAVERRAAPLPVRARLHVIRAMGDGPLLYELRNTITSVGAKADIVLQNDPFLSAKHALLTWRNGTLELMDAESQNGTFLRIRRPMELEFGDVFIAGEELLRVDPTPTPNDGPDSSPTYFYSSPKWSTSFRIVQIWQGGSLGSCVVARSNSLQIGRTGSDLNFPHDMWLTDPHCIVEDQGGFLMLTDLRSRAGTFLPIKAPARLTTGDEILLGRTRLRVEIVPTPRP